MFEFDVQKRRKSVIVLQLAPMIDIFVLVIVFLLKGTVMGETVISNPEAVTLAKSQSRETTEIAPEVYITESHVDFRMIEEIVSVETLSQEGYQISAAMLAKFKKVIAQTPAADSGALIHVNIVADYRVNYKTIYNVVRVLRLAGFKAMLFIAEGEQT